MSWGNMILVEFISIHALRVEGDAGNTHEMPTDVIISIHALRVEGDLAKIRVLCVCALISIHALRVEGDDANPVLLS